MQLRKLWALAAALLLLFASAPFEATSASEDGRWHIVVLVSHDAAPYRDALKGIRRTLEQHGADAVVEEFDVQHDAMKIAAAIDRVRRERNRLILTLGTPATEFAETEGKSLPVVACLVLNTEVLSRGNNSTGVVLQVPLRQQFDWMQRLLHPAARIAVLYNPRENQARIDEAQRIARDAGFELVPVLVATAQMLPTALEDAVSRADALWVIPDSLVVSPETAKTLLLASFRSRVPMIGLSSAWVKAGALFALDWNYEEVGAQCGDIALQIVAGARPGSIAPINARHSTYALNLRTAREMRVELSDSLVASAAQVFE
jgi:putative ABC transport system substrate-binding protein